jgi:hypothetical protein
MDRSGRVWVYGGFATSFLAVGIPYWSIPYQAVNLPNAVWKPGLIVVAATAGILCVCAAARFWRIVAITGASVPAAVLARVAVETSRDPTSHNLWPFELVIALGVGLAAALAGAAVGSVGARLLSTRSEERPS